MVASDDELRAAVDEELAWDPRVDDTRVTVTVRHGVVTLRGAVGSYPQKRAAGADAGRVLGIARVDDALEVELPETSRRTDAELRRTVEATLATNCELGASTVEVHAEDGWITLTGRVPWHCQRVVADRLAAGTVGVYGVTNDIELVPVTSPPQGLRTTILQAVSRTTHTSGVEVSIGVSSDGVVMLHGVTPSARERDCVVDAAWRAPGVVQVVSDIRLAAAPVGAHRLQPGWRHG
ncbi:BON domain-containing protein [Flexivirga caeni]|uniref:BON domain-containing protein n=1 Tax=Flexivirga caeni TaxID=2294115 RepID=A0A3M9MGR5_9MICO|nr:BON domain-containing protein [Flexivirga caeni]RNI24385.1 BON domain-containing protein [Flexivirga caeni]